MCFHTLLQCMETCIFSMQPDTCMGVCICVVWTLAFTSASVFGLEEVAAKALAAGKKGMTGLLGEERESLVAEMRIG